MLSDLDAEPETPEQEIDWSAKIKKKRKRLFNKPAAKNSLQNKPNRFWRLTLKVNRSLNRIFLKTNTPSKMRLAESSCP